MPNSPVPDNPETEKKFLDERTGENVIHKTVPEKFLPLLEKSIEEQNKKTQAFLNLSMNLASLLKIWQMEFENHVKIQEDIGKNVIKIREQMGLDNGWVYNIPLKVMEKRLPPADMGTWDSLIK